MYITGHTAYIEPNIIHNQEGTADQEKYRFFQKNISIRYVMI
jgi:6-phosphogluconolactonase/glucosamine-6-phosphate isomerase/deaminase